MTKIVYCRHRKNNSVECGNIIGVIEDENTLVVSKHGRKIKVRLAYNYPIELTCEKCKCTTIIRGGK